MVKLFFDIETLPAHEDHKEKILSKLKAKKSKRGNGDSFDEEKVYHDTGLDGAYGRICCIGYIKEDGRVVKGCLKGDEREILEEFWKLVQDVDLFVGHNIWGFDLPFIYKRSIINGVKPRFDISFRRYVNQPIFDTMVVWDLWNLDRFKAVSLDTLAHVLDLPTSKDEMDGSMVWDYYQKGRLEDICKYCMKDVELVRQVYYKMTFEEMILEEELEEVREELF